jgi:uncharacterized protein (DUF1501 family)
MSAPLNSRHGRASPPSFLPATRREFLRYSGRGLGLLALSRFAPSFLLGSELAGPPAPGKDRPILVLVQLAGGNDGLNTLVPFEDSDYYRLRPTLGLAKDRVLRLNDTLGLHPACGALHRLFGEGKVSLVQNVGYPNPNRSHFRSMEIWETASPSNEFLPTGWVGRYLDSTCGGRPAAPDPVAVHLSASLPQSFVGEREHITFGLSPDRRHHCENDESHRLATAYPDNNFAHSLSQVAALVAAGLPTRVYFVSLSGFDTHSNQANQHTNLLTTLSEGLAAFQRDLESRRLDRQVLTMTFSEFGRRPGENESRGTDHGTAAPLFVIGPQVRGGLHGTPPSLKLAPNQDLAFSTDFRQVYATVLDRWLGCPNAAALDGHFEPLRFI